MNKTININNKNVDNEYYKYIEQKKKYKQQVIQLYNDGYNIYKISKLIGLSMPSIKLIIQDLSKE